MHDYRCVPLDKFRQYYAEMRILMHKLLVICGVAMVLGCKGNDGQATTTVTPSGLANVNDAHIYYEVSGKGTDVILIHGFTLDSRMWDAQFDELASKYRVTRFDLRGHGKSSGAKEPFDPAQDILGLMDFLQIEKAHVIGLSLGGEIAADFVLRYPRRALSMTLVDAYYSITSDQHQVFVDRVAKYIDQARHQSLESGLRSWCEDSLFEAARSQQSVRRHLEEIVIRGHSAQGSGALFVNLSNKKASAVPATERLEDYAIPTLVLIGELDLPVFHEVAGIFAAGVKDARKVVVPGAGHMSNMEKPYFVTEHILSFLKAVP